MLKYPSRRFWLYCRLMDEGATPPAVYDFRACENRCWVMLSDMLPRVEIITGYEY